MPLKLERVRLEGTTLHLTPSMVGEKEGMVITGNLIFLANVVMMALLEALTALAMPASIQPAISSATLPVGSSRTTTVFMLLKVICI